MDTPNISGAIGGVVAVVITGWLLSKVRPDASALEDGKKVLRYHVSYAVTGWVGFVFFGALLLGVSLSHQPARVLWWCLAIFGSLALLSAIIIVMHRRCTLAYEDDSILYSPLWGPSFRFSWPDIEAVNFSGTAQWWRLRLRDGRSARVSTYMNGALEFLGLLSGKTGLHFPAVRLPDGRVLDPTRYKSRP